jgi:hypothetical protein
MAHYREKAIRAGPASAASRRNAAPIAPRPQNNGRRSCAHPPGNGPRALGASQSGGARYAGAVDEVASIPTAALRRAGTRWRYALPLDTARVTSRVRVRVSADGAITPAISVLSALEGLESPFQALRHTCCRSRPLSWSPCF